MNACAPFRVKPCLCVTSPDGTIIFRVCDPCFVREAKILEKKVENETYREDERAS